MITLKNKKAKRWYRIKDGVVYDILTTEPTSNMSADYIASTDANCLLPYLKVYYGYMYNQVLTKYDDTYEKLYLDTFIEDGDLVIKDEDGKYKFSPYINNGEFVGEKPIISYMNIHEQTIKNFIQSEIVKKTNPTSILALIPYYSQTINENHTKIIQLQKMNGKSVNCIYKIELVNDVLSDIFDFQMYYPEIVIEMVNNICIETAQSTLKYQNISIETPINGSHYVVRNTIVNEKTDNHRNKITLTCFPTGLSIDEKYNIITINGTLGRDCVKVMLNGREVSFTYEEGDCSDLGASQTIISLPKDDIALDTVKLEFYYSIDRDSLESLIRGVRDLISLDLTEFDISEIKNMCTLCENCTPSEIDHQGILFKSAPLSYVGPKRNDDSCFDENGEENESYAPFFNYNGKVKVPADRMELFANLFKGLNEEQIEKL